MKLCPKCGQDLRTDGFCDHCKMSFQIYDKIKNISKLLYNQGLQLSEARDLTGAVGVLQRSVKLDRNNIDARNLLGLVYFEIGETVLALQQWVVSKSLRSTNNNAEKYIKTIQDNQTHLEALNSSIKKYNMALQFANQSDDDMAIMNLKKAVSLNPNFIKAYALLALCLMKDSQIQKAQKALKSILEIDKHNFIARKYLMQMINSTDIDHIKEEKAVEDHQSNSGGIKLPNLNMSSFQQVFFVAGGAVLGIAVAVFLLLPSQIKGRDTEIRTLTEQAIVYESNKTAAEASIKTLTAEKEQLQKEQTQMKSDLKTEQSINAETAKMLMALQSYGVENYIETAETLHFIDPTVLEGTDLFDQYNALTLEVYEKVATDTFNQGYTFYKKSTTDSYQKAIDQFDISIKYKKDAYFTDDAYYYRAVSYYKLGNMDEAKKAFENLIKDFADSDRVDDATWYLKKF